jgi:hypothetical protein
MAVGCGTERGAVGSEPSVEDNGNDNSQEQSMDDSDGENDHTEESADDDGEHTTTNDDPGEESDLPMFDLVVPDLTPEEGGEACDVDLLFIIDNSVSMGDYQTAIGLAFPAFAESLRATLPSATNVHVGVTSSEMGYSSSGNTSQGPNGCTFTGDNDADYETFYVTPDVSNSGRNGAQGRLYRPEGKDAFFAIDMSADEKEFEALADWFRSAAAVGTGGSNIEMITAPVGWVAAPENDAVNHGFVRDRGTVMVAFFMQDEPDQTPSTIDGEPGGEALLERLAAAKAACGGVECIVAGGFTDLEACGGTRPIRGFVDGLTRPAAIAPLPNGGSPQEIADQMNELLTTALLATIEEACNDIVPPK